MSATATNMHMRVNGSVAFYTHTYKDSNVEIFPDWLVCLKPAIMSWFCKKAPDDVELTKSFPYSVHILVKPPEPPYNQKQ